ncbi:UNVERIFIED_CONTAM: E3 ubiquitin-protein ligase KEG [Sesamum radiatum]|uniref:E3 ubiquitin-protein ligase KEG n=1 Tax=Sesamum radiatum TaxID=300843 RepID=A0AAW2S5I7_SESRA
MRVPCCSVCQNKYNEEERCPLLLQCGHGFCRECLSKMFTASPDSSLSCPRCRHVSTVGNSVSALKKNYAVLSLIQGGEDEDEDDEEDDDGNEAGHDDRTFVTSHSSCGGNNTTGHNSSSGGVGGCVYNNGSRSGGWV